MTLGMLCLSAQSIEVDVKRARSAGVQVPALSNNRLERAYRKLPGVLRRDINETYLLHGTAPDLILNLIAGGLNERYSKVAAFGNGNYFAEDCAKNDQYVTNDPSYGAHADLHRRIYSKSYGHPNTKVYYLFLCRVTMGACVRTATFAPSSTDLDRPGKKVFPISPRELGTIPGVTPATLFHGLIVEDHKPPTNLRFREFLVFHGEYAYPEYMLAYRRV